MYKIVQNLSHTRVYYINGRQGRQRQWEFALQISIQAKQMKSSTIARKSNLKFVKIYQV